MVKKLLRSMVLLGYRYIIEAATSRERWQACWIEEDL
jgi:hypothetical protein